MKDLFRASLAGPAADLLWETRKVVLRTTIGVILTSTTIAAAGEVPNVMSTGLPVNWASFIERFGITVTLLLFFVWRDYKNTRELRAQNIDLSRRLQTVETETNRELKDILRQTVGALQASTSAALEVKAVVEHCRQRT
jgi:hypothetical protein